MLIKEYIRLLRPRQWAKNLFVFLAMFFGGRMSDASCWLPTIYGFISFCLASSSVYCLNDVLDKEYDCRNPNKRNRPVASGAISVGMAIITALCLAMLAGGIAYLLINIEALWVIVGYLILNLLYSFGLKHIGLIDVGIIAIGFVLRLIMGSVTTDISLSSWIIIMVFLLSLFLAMAKRRGELSRAGEKSRKSISGYNIRYIDLVLVMLAAVMIVAYVIYTVQPTTIAQFGTDKLYISSLFVLGGIMRYLQIVVVGEDSEDPTGILYKDKMLLCNILCWLICFIIAIYI